MPFTFSPGNQGTYINNYLHFKSGLENQITFSWAAKRVVSWSSLDWDRGRWNQIDLVLGTLFDIAVHAMNCVLLSPFVDSTRDLLLGTAAVIILVAVVLYNPKLAWANPDAVPTWVKKRMRPLTDDQRQEIAGLEAVSRTILASAK